MPQGIFADPGHGRLPDSPSGNVQDPADGQVVAAVIHRLEVGQHIADFPSVVKVGAAYHVVWHAAQDQAVLQQAGLGIGAVQDGKIAVWKRRT